MVEKSGICFECGGEVFETDEPVLYPIREQEIEVSGIPHSTCTSCGEIFFPAGAYDLMQKNAADQYRRKNGLLTGGEIKTIREGLGLSQAAFEKLLGVGAKTVIRWEKNTVFQSKAADNLMRLLVEVPETVGVLRAYSCDSEDEARSEKDDTVAASSIVDIQTLRGRKGSPSPLSCPESKQVTEG